MHFVQVLKSLIKFLFKLFHYPIKVLPHTICCAVSPASKFCIALKKNSTGNRDMTDCFVYLIRSKTTLCVTILN